MVEVQKESLIRALVNLVYLSVMLSFVGFFVYVNVMVFSEEPK